MRAFEIEKQLEEVTKELNELKSYVSYQKQFLDVEDYIEYLGSDDFHATCATISHKKIKIIQLVSQL
jgi:hypothetical protein